MENSMQMFRDNFRNGTGLHAWALNGFIQDAPYRSRRAVKKNSEFRILNSEFVTVSVETKETRLT